MTEGRATDSPWFIGVGKNLEGEEVKLYSRIKDRLNSHRGTSSTAESSVELCEKGNKRITSPTPVSDVRTLSVYATRILAEKEAKEGEGRQRGRLLRGCHDALAGRLRRRAGGGAFIAVVVVVVVVARRRRRRLLRNRASEGCVAVASSPPPSSERRNAPWRRHSRRPIVDGRSGGWF